MIYNLCVPRNIDLKNETVDDGDINSNRGSAAKAAGPNPRMTTNGDGNDIASNGINDDDGENGDDGDSGDDAGDGDNDAMVEVIFLFLVFQKTNL